MRSRWSSFTRLIFYLVIVGLLVGAFAMHSPEAFVQVPGERDPEVLGDWYMDRYGRFRHYIFKEDGTGEIWSSGREPRKFQWGTEEDKLRLKYQSQNGWTAPLYEYAVQSGGLMMTDLENGYQLNMSRQSPAGAGLQ
jgi:hypothetical protein